jgi:hypothetical protein
MLRLLSTILLSVVVLAGTLFAQDVEITPLSINSKYSEELFPSYIDSSLIFASNRRSSVIKNYSDENDNLLFHLYITKLKPDSTWSKPEELDNTLNTPFNNGQVWFADDGNTAYVTRNHYDTYSKSKKSRSGNGLGIYVTTKNNAGNWTRPKSLPINSRRNYNTGQPTLSPDGKLMFFVSDMNNGYGKTDIFFSENINGTWSAPQNLGNKINTPESEITPYFHPSGKLYFASDGLGGLGGLDIFYTVQTDEGWTDPVNIGAPYNSPYNDYAYFVAAPDDWGFFTSNRSGVDDIYRADPRYPSFDNITPQKELKYCGTLFEKKMDDKDTARFEFSWDMGDGVVMSGKKVHHCYKKPGKYHVVLTVSDKEGQITEDYVSSYDLDIKKKKQIYISSPDTVKINSAIDFNTALSFFGDFEPDTFYWNFGEGFKTKGANVTYTFRKPGVYTVSCGAFSKTQPDETMCNSKMIIVTE